MLTRSGLSWLRVRRYRWIMVLVAVLLMLSFMAAAWLLRPGSAPGYLTATATRGDIEDSVLASGILQPIRKVEVGAQVNGQLKSIKVRLGQKVAKGQLLAEIDAQLAITDALMAQADLTVLQAERRGKLAKSDEGGAQWRRQQVLLTQQATSLSAWQQARADYLSLAAELAALDARIRKARYGIAQQQARLSYTRITAPIAGEVLQIDTQEGQTVVSAQQAAKILTLGDLSSIEVRAQVSEADIMRVRPGLPAYFQLLGSSQQRYHGVVREIQPMPEKINNAQFFNVLFDVGNPEHILRSNMSAQVSIVLQSVRHCLQVPLTALGEPAGDGWYWVKLAATDGAPVARKVRIGLKSRSHAQVLEGLAEGERVITGSSAAVQGEEVDP